jgi:hypothetical protein
MTLTQNLRQHRTGFLGPVLLIACHKDNLFAIRLAAGRQMESVSPGNHSGQGNEGKEDSGTHGNGAGDVD